MQTIERVPHVHHVGARRYRDKSGLHPEHPDVDQGVIVRPKKCLRLRLDIAGYATPQNGNDKSSDRLLPVGDNWTGRALVWEVLPGVDVLFLDAIKSEYVGYFELVRSLIPVGGLVIADNVYGTGEGWIDQGLA